MQRRLHSFTGMAPLGLYLVFHLWENWAVLSGRQAWAERTLLTDARFGFGIDLAFYLSLALHVILCWRRAEPLPGNSLQAESHNSPAGLPSPEELLDQPGLQRLQRITGLVVLFFMALHLYQVWFYEYGGQVLSDGPYQVLRSELGSPLQAGIYAVAITVVYFHLAHGVSRAAVTWGLVTTKRSLVRIRYAAGAFGFMLWGLTLHVLGYFVAGQGLFRL